MPQDYFYKTFIKLVYDVYRLTDLTLIFNLKYLKK